MLVDINLLPQKEPKKFSFLITLSCLLALLVLIGGFYFWKTQMINDEITSLDKQISMTKKIAEKQDENSETVVSTDSVSQLKSAIKWVDEYPIQTIPIMRHLTSLLPERGFIQSFGYTESGAVALTVQFDTAREAAYFLDGLNHSKWIQEASLNSLSTALPETETNATSNPVVSNSQANTTSAANQTTTTDTTSSVESQNNTSTDTTTEQSRTNNTTNNTTNQTIDNNSTTDSNSATSESTSNILPRYTGQFEIKFDKEAIKKIIKKSKIDEGVKDS